MRIVAVSDMHLGEEFLRALLAAAEEADLVIVAGDLAQRHEGLEAYAAGLTPIASKTIVVPGNNETETALRAATSARVLHGETADLGALRVAGLGGGVPELTGAPFPSFDLSEEEAEAMLDGITEADILVTHSPPEGVADRLGGRSIGSKAIRAAVERLQPRLHLFGHVHYCWGQRGTIGLTACMNLGPVPVLIEVST